MSMSAPAQPVFMVLFEILSMDMYATVCQDILEGSVKFVCITLVMCNTFCNILMYTCLIPIYILPNDCYYMSISIKQLI